MPISGILKLTPPVELGKYFEWIINTFNRSHKLIVCNLQSTEFFQTGVYDVVIPLNTYCFVSLRPSQIVELKQISLFIIRQIREIWWLFWGFNKPSSAKNGVLRLSILRGNKNKMWKKETRNMQLKTSGWKGNRRSFKESNFAKTPHKII